MRYLLVLLALLLATPAQAQQTKAQLNTEVTNNFPDNTTGLITPAILRTTVNDFISSWQQAPRVNPQTGTTYTFTVADYGYLVTFNSASAVAVTLPQATGSFATWNAFVRNLGAGTVTITPTTSTINGAATLVLATGQAAAIISDGTNYQTTFNPTTSVACGGMPALTGDVTTSAGSCATSYANIVGLSKGGTNAALTASNGGIVWSTGSALAILAGTATANLPLLSGATATPSWATVQYVTSASSGGIAYFSSATAMGSSAVATQFGPLLGGGAGGAPTSMAAGTDAQLIVGQSASSPLWKTVTGDWTISLAGVSTVAKVNGVSYPASPSTNTVPVVTGANTVTYEAVPNAALANSSITLNVGTNVGLTSPGAMTLGSTNTIGSTADTPRFAGLGLGGTAGTRGLKIYGATSGSLLFDVATAAGSNTITFPAGTTDFSATGGASQVLKQTSAGGAITVAQLAFSDISSTLAAAQVATTTITGQTVNNSPSASNDYFLYFDSVNNRISKCTVGACASAATAGVSSLNGLTGGLSLASTGSSTISAGGSTVTVVAANIMPQGRLTLQTTVPVMVTSQSAKGTLYYDCYNGNAVPYYNGTNDTYDTISACEVSNAMVSAASAGQVVSGNVYDVWWVHGGANRICLAMSASSGGGGGWSSDTAGSNTARGTGYSQLDLVSRPYITNKNAIANCFNGSTNYGSVAINQGTYLGTVYASANGQISYTFGAAASGGTAGQLGVWNAYNRVNVSTCAADSKTTWTYATGSWGQLDGSAGNQISVVRGLDNEGVAVVGGISISGGNPAVLGGGYGIGLDSTSGPVAGSAIGYSEQVAQTTSTATWNGLPGVGYHTITALQYKVGTGTINYFGTGGDSPGGAQMQNLCVSDRM